MNNCDWWRVSDGLTVTCIINDYLFYFVFHYFVLLIVNCLKKLKCLCSKSKFCALYIFNPSLPPLEVRHKWCQKSNYLGKFRIILAFIH